jgi:hypothetical protein
VKLPRLVRLPHKTRKMDLLSRPRASILQSQRCGFCQGIIGRNEFERQPLQVHYSPRCTLCRLLLSVIAFTQSLKIDPLRSYAVRPFRLIHDSNISASGRPRLIWSSDGDFAVEEMYSESKTELPRDPDGIDPQNGYITKVKPRRSVCAHSRLPLAAFRSHFGGNPLSYVGPTG